MYLNVFQPYADFPVARFGWIIIADVMKLNLVSVPGWIQITLLLINF